MHENFQKSARKYQNCYLRRIVPCVHGCCFTALMLSSALGCILLSEGDAASVEAVYDGEALDVVAHLPQAVAAALEAFLNDESHAGDGSA